MAKVLIGTPIHEMKDYSIKRWLESVLRLEIDKKDYWRLLMVDNSQNKDWQERVKEYCRELNFFNYDFIGLSDMKDGSDFELERLAFSREKIRHKLLYENYDFWFSWECDILCPPEILKTFLRYTSEFEVIYHSYSPRGGEPIGTGGYVKQDGIGCALFSRRVFYEFKFTEGNLILGADGRLIFETLRRGFKIMEIHNFFRLEHLAI